MVEANVPQPQFRTERSGPGLLRVPTPSGSVFLVTGLLHLRPRSWQAAVALASRPIPAYSGIQKTFSAGPCSFSTRELWFPGSAWGAPGVQPLLDSRHGRIAWKTLSSPFLKNREPPPPISPVAPVSNTCPGWRRLSKISSFSLLVSSGGPPLPISHLAQGPTPFAGWRRPSQIHFRFCADSGNIRRAS